MPDFPLCSDCFSDQGLKLDASRIGITDNSVCPNCGTTSGNKLSKKLIATLAHRYFVWGTLHRCEYGAAPVVQFNEHQQTSIEFAPWFEADLHLIEKAIGIGFFYYGPRLWMVGVVEPLKALQDSTTRSSIIERIISEYPAVILTTEQIFYRLRKAPTKPAEIDEYDSPPIALAGSGRLDSKAVPVMYASQDLQVCVHECRVAAEDDVFLATLKPTRNLKLLDLTELLHEDETEFESLDMAVHMLFLAGTHSYEISREMARAAHKAGYEGFIYPSYFSLLRTGGMPFETTFGISHRRIPQLAEREKSKIIPNLALFGRPIEQGLVRIGCINRLILSRVEYDIHFGPVGYESEGVMSEPAVTSLVQKLPTMIQDVD
jgi:hypothetical protein